MSANRGVPGRASCIMATSGRAAMAARSCELFAAQNYPDRELVIVADRGELELDPAWGKNITLLEVPPRTPIGTRRNLACHHATGEWIAQWDDDDWRGAGCIEALAGPLCAGRADIVGFTGTPFFELENGSFWDTREMLERVFPKGIHPGTLAFRRGIWESGRYPARTGGEDLDLLESAARRGARVEPIDARGGEHFIYVRHGDNTWKLKRGVGAGGESWIRIPEDRIPAQATRWLGDWKKRHLRAGTPMVGATIASPAARAMAEEATDRFTWATGLPAYIRTDPADNCYRAKFDLARDLGGTVVYFDADLWFLRRCDLTTYHEREPFFAALDPGRFVPAHFPLKDCRTLGMDPARYFNSAFMIWNQRHLAMWEAARAISGGGFHPNLHDPLEPLEGGGRLADFGEQSYINAALQRTRTPLEILPDTLNYMPFVARQNIGYPHLPHPVTCHAAGYSIYDKHEFLKFFARQWSAKPS